MQMEQLISRIRSWNMNLEIMGIWVDEDYEPRELR